MGGRVPDPLKFCQTCGTAMERKRFNGRLEDRTRFLARKNCSQSCGNTRTEIQPDSHRWRARQVKKRVACEACGSRERLHVHHDDRDVANNDPANLRTLCASCHLKLHWREDRAARLAACRSTGHSTRRRSAAGKRSSADPLLLPSSLPG